MRTIKALLLSGLCVLALEGHSAGRSAPKVTVTSASKKPIRVYAFHPSTMSNEYKHCANYFTTGKPVVDLKPEAAKRILEVRTVCGDHTEFSLPIIHADHKISGEPGFLLVEKEGHYALCSSSGDSNITIQTKKIKTGIGPSIPQGVECVFTPLEHTHSVGSREMSSERTSKKHDPLNSVMDATAHLERLKNGR